MIDNDINNSNSDHEHSFEEHNLEANNADNMKEEDLNGHVDNKSNLELPSQVGEVDDFKHENDNLDDEENEDEKNRKYLESLNTNPKDDEKSRKLSSRLTFDATKSDNGFQDLRNAGKFHRVAIMMGTRKRHIF